MHLVWFVIIIIIIIIIIAPQVAMLPSHWALVNYANIILILIGTFWHSRLLKLLFPFVC